MDSLIPHPGSQRGGLAASCREVSRTLPECVWKETQMKESYCHRPLSWFMELCQPEGSQASRVDSGREVGPRRTGDCAHLSWIHLLKWLTAQQGSCLSTPGRNYSEFWHRIVLETCWGFIHWIPKLAFPEEPTERPVQLRFCLPLFKWAASI